MPQPSHQTHSHHTNTTTKMVFERINIIILFGREIHISKNRRRPPLFLLLLLFVLVLLILLLEFFMLMRGKGCTIIWNFSSVKTKQDFPRNTGIIFTREVVPRRAAGHHHHRRHYYCHYSRHLS